MLETYAHPVSSFITLTYEDEKLPKDGSVHKEHLQGWIKRLRERLNDGHKIRYFMVGEYGEKGRPHYHCAVFGFPGCERGQTEHRIKKCCDVCELVSETWGFGGVDVGELNSNSASYVAGYVQKKLIKGDLEKCGLQKEFSLKSLKPGIGAMGLDVLSDAVKRTKGIMNAWQGDVPNVLRHSGKLWPLGRYLKRKIREQIGCGGDTPEHVVESQKNKMQRMFGEVIENEKDEEVKRYFRAAGKKAIYQSLNVQKNRNFDSKQKIYERGRS